MQHPWEFPVTENCRVPGRSITTTMAACGMWTVETHKVWSLVMVWPAAVPLLHVFSKSVRVPVPADFAPFYPFI